MTRSPIARYDLGRAEERPSPPCLRTRVVDKAREIIFVKESYLISFNSYDQSPIYTSYKKLKYQKLFSLELLKSFSVPTCFNSCDRFLILDFFLSKSVAFTLPFRLPQV